MNIMIFFLFFFAFVGGKPICRKQLHKLCPDIDLTEPNAVLDCWTQNKRHMKKSHCKKTLERWVRRQQPQASTIISQVRCEFLPIECREGLQIPRTAFCRSPEPGMDCAADSTITNATARPCRHDIRQYCPHAKKTDHCLSRKKVCARLSTQCLKYKQSQDPLFCSSESRKHLHKRRSKRSAYRVNKPGPLPKKSQQLQSHNLFVTTFSPWEGPTEGGTAVTISGGGFDKDDLVVLYGDQVMECDYASWTDSNLICITPPLANSDGFAVGTVLYVPIIVAAWFPDEGYSGEWLASHCDDSYGCNFYATASESKWDYWAPTIQSISPPSGTVVGGTSLTLSGVDLFPDFIPGDHWVAINVFVDNTICQVDWEQWTDTQVVCVTGMRDRKQVAAATASSNCHVGDEVTAKYVGNGGLYGAIIASIDGVADTITVNWDDGDPTYRVISSENVFTLTGDSCVRGLEEPVSLQLMDVTANRTWVIAPEWLKYKYTPDSSYFAGPVILSVSPVQADASGGTQITLTGRGFVDRLEVRFGDTLCEIQSGSTSEELICVLQRVSQPQSLRQPATITIKYFDPYYIMQAVSDTHTLLEHGQPFESLTTQKRGKWHYFYVIVDKMSIDLQLNLLLSEGDADLYVSPSVMLPNQTSADTLVSHKAGDDHAIIHNAVATYFIGVYSYSDATYSIEASFDNAKAPLSYSMDSFTLNQKISCTGGSASTNSPQSGDCMFHYVSDDIYIEMVSPSSGLSLTQGTFLTITGRNFEKFAENAGGFSYEEFRVMVGPILCETRTVTDSEVVAFCLVDGDYFQGYDVLAELRWPVTMRIYNTELEKSVYAMCLSDGDCSVGLDQLPAYSIDSHIYSIDYSPGRLKIIAGVSDITAIYVYVATVGQYEPNSCELISAVAPTPAPTSADPRASSLNLTTVLEISCSFLSSEGGSQEDILDFGSAVELTVPVSIMLLSNSWGILPLYCPTKDGGSATCNAILKKPAPKHWGREWSVEEALQDADYANKAYSSKEKLEKIWIGENDGFKVTRIVEVEELNTFALMGVHQSRKQIVVSFRGTVMGTNNMVQDLEAIPRRYGKNGALVHSGFLDDWLSLKAGIESHFQELLNLYPGFTVTITGHSLGGALASLCAYDLAPQTDRGVYLHTFGEPRVGMTQFSEELEDIPNIVGIHRVVNDADPVPRLVPVPYVHTAREIWLTTDLCTKCDLSGEDGRCSGSYTWIQSAGATVTSTMLGFLGSLLGPLGTVAGYALGALVGSGVYNAFDHQIEEYISSLTNLKLLESKSDKRVC